jgi:hypothetical protein
MRPTLLLLGLAIGLVAGCGGATVDGAPPWTQLDATALPARWGQVAVRDARRDRMLVFGGEGSSGQRADLWSFDFAHQSWREIEVGSGPTPRTDLVGTIDPVHDRLIVYGGRVGLATSLDEVWSFDLARELWSPLPAGPPARHDTELATDGQSAWVFGGAGVLFQSLDDLWELDFATDRWRSLPDDGVRPPARGSGALAYRDGALYLVGGHDVDVVHRDVWRYDLMAGRWSELAPNGQPVAGAHYGAAFDPACGALYLFGGDNLDNYDLAFTDAFSIVPPSFLRVPASVLPPPRDHPSLVFDPDRGRLLLLGGGSLGDGLGLLGDFWAYSPAGCP